MSPVRNKILKIRDTLFELKQIEAQCSKNYLKFLLPQETGAFGNNIEKKPQNPRPELNKYVHYIFTENICSVYSLMLMVVFCKNVVIL